MASHVFHRPPGEPLPEPVVFLPGWGLDGRVIELLEYAPGWIYPTTTLDPKTLTDDLLAFLDREHYGRVVLVGWSMGANLALDFAGAHPDRVAALHLLAMRRSWPAAEIEAIRTELAADPDGFLVSFYRKCFLGHKEAYQRFSQKLQDSCLAAHDLTRLEKGLAYLGAAEVREPPAGVPVRLVHGGRDIVVPVDQRAELAGAQTQVLEQASHAVFTAPGFEPPTGLQKQVIRRRFSSAASTYDTHAAVQKELAHLLAEGLDCKPGSILEIGCGTGNYTLLLANRFPQARILALDFSEAMLKVARAKLGPAPLVQFLCADGETLAAVAKQQFDLITSNATMQWFDDVDTALGRIAGLLKPGGALHCSIFGPRTLGELEEGMGMLFGHRFNLPSGRFPDQRALQRSLQRHFSQVEIAEHSLPRRYASIRDLLGHIKKTGAVGWRQAPPPVLTRSRMAQLEKWFQERHGAIRVTYQAFVIRGMP